MDIFCTFLEAHIIGNSFCIHYDDTSPFVLGCELDRSDDVPSPVPTPSRIWKKDGQKFSSESVLQPEVEESFLNHTRMNAAFGEGIDHFPPIQILPTGAIVLDTSLKIPNVDRRKVFEQFLGTYECNVENVFGNSTNRTTIRDCG